MIGNVTIIGTCSICGGPVTVPAVWHGVVAPRPQCSQCGAIAAVFGPVIPMQPVQPLYPSAWPSTTLPWPGWYQPPVTITLASGGG